MALSAGYTALASDVKTVINNVNRTLTRYGISNVSTVSAGGIIYASVPNTMISRLQTADRHVYNTRYNAYYSALSGMVVSAGGTLISATLLNNLSAYATNIYNSYCSCNCNNCCTCNCNNCCTCNCNNCCGCNCNYCCTCNCNNCCACNGYTCSYCYGSSWYCQDSQQCCCFVPETIVFTSKGPKQVKDLQSGDFVLNESGEYVEVKYAWKIDVNNVDINKYQVNDIVIKATKNHFIPMDSEHQYVFYPNFKQEKTIPNLHGELNLPEEFLLNLPYLMNALIRIEQDRVIFKNNDTIVSLLNNIFPKNGIETFEDTVSLIFSLHNNHSTAILFSPFIIDNKPTLPGWIYNIPTRYIEHYHQIFKTNLINFEDNTTLALQFKLLLSSLKYIYILENNTLIYKYTLNNYQEKVTITSEVYSGPVYNFVCNNGSYIVGEILIGDGSIEY